MSIKMLTKALESIACPELNMKQSRTQSAIRWPVAYLTALLLGLLPFVSNPVALAQNANCNAPETQLEMNICAQQDFETADGLLNTEYAKARTYMKSIDADLQEQNRGAARALLEAQRAWIVFRDLACKAEGFLVKGGSMEPLFISTCKTTLTQQRTEALRQLVETN